MYWHWTEWIKITSEDILVPGCRHHVTLETMFTVCHVTYLLILQSTKLSWLEHKRLNHTFCTSAYELIWYSAYLDMVVWDRLLAHNQPVLSILSDSSAPCCVCVRISTGWSGLASTSDIDENSPRSSTNTQIKPLSSWFLHQHCQYTWKVTSFVFYILDITMELVKCESNLSK